MLIVCVGFYLLYGLCNDLCEWRVFMKHFMSVKSLFAVMLFWFGFCIVTNIGLNTVIAADKTLPIYMKNRAAIMLCL